MTNVDFVSITDLHALAQRARALQEEIAALVADDPPSGDLISIRLTAPSQALAVQARAHLLQRLSPHVTLDPPRQGRAAWLVYGLLALPRRAP